MRFYKILLFMIAVTFISCATNKLRTDGIYIEKKREPAHIFFDVMRFYKDTVCLNASVLLTGPDDYLEVIKWFNKSNKKTKRLLETYKKIDRKTYLGVECDLSNDSLEQKNAECYYKIIKITNKNNIKYFFINPNQKPVKRIKYRYLKFKKIKNLK